MLETKEPELAPEKMAEPPKRWKLHLRFKVSVVSLRCKVCGQSMAVTPTIYMPHCSTYPSRDVALTTWQNSSDETKVYADLIGAEPVD